MAELRNPQALPDNVLDQIDSLVEIYEAEINFLSSRFPLNDSDTDFTINIADSTAESALLNIAATGASLGVAIASSGPNFLRNTRFSAIRDTFISGRFRTLRTELITEIASFRSAVEIRKAGETGQFTQKKRGFAYIGPRDGKNREFCAAVLDRNRLFSLEEINRDLERLANDTNHPGPRPVRSFMGGWRCRHTWIWLLRT